MYDFLDICEVEEACVVSTGEEALWHLRPLAIFSHYSVWIGSKSAVNLLVLEHFPQRLDTSHAFEADARVVVHLEVQAHAHERTLLHSEGMRNRFALCVTRYEVQDDGPVWRHRPIRVELHAHIEEFYEGWRCYIRNEFHVTILSLLGYWVVGLSLIKLILGNLLELVTINIICLEFFGNLLHSGSTLFSSLALKLLVCHLTRWVCFNHNFFVK